MLERADIRVSLRITGKLDQLLLHAEAFQLTLWHSCRMINFLEPQGAVPPGFNPLWRGWVYRPAPEAPLFRGMPTGSEAFLELPLVLGFGPATGPTLKTALCHIRTLVGRRINTARSAFASCRGFSADSLAFVSDD